MISLQMGIHKNDNGIFPQQDKKIFHWLHYFESKIYRFLVWPVNIINFRSTLITYIVNKMSQLSENLCTQHCYFIADAYRLKQYSHYFFDWYLWGSECRSYAAIFFDWSPFRTSYTRLPVMVSMVVKSIKIFCLFGMCCL
jgi:hypothetical protein